MLALFHEMLCRRPQRHRLAPHFQGKHRAAEKMGANGLGEVLATPRTQVRAASTQDVRGEFRVAEADVTDRASRDDVARTVEEDELSLLTLPAERRGRR